MSDLNTTHDVINDTLPTGDSDQQDTVETIHNQLEYLQQLYALSSALLKASTPQELLEVIITPLENTDIRASIYKTIYDDNGQAEYAEAIAQHNAYIPVGGRFSLKTAIGRALASAPTTPIIIEDVSQGHAVIDAPLAAVLATNKVTSLTFVPLASTDGRWIATMQLSWHQPFSIPQTVLDLYEILIPQLAAVIDNRWLLVEAQQSLREAARLHETSARLSDAHDEQAIVEVMGDVLHAENINAVTLTLFNTGDRDTSTEYRVMGSWRADGHSIRGESGQIAEIPLGNHLNRSQIVVFNDLTTDPRLDPVTREAMQQQGSQSLAVVPLTLGVRWMGYLSISSAQPYYYPAATLNFLEIVGEQLTSLLDRFALIRQTERRAQELQTVAEVSASAAQNLNLDDLLQTVTNLVKERFGLYHAHIYLLDKRENLLKLTAGAGEVGRQMVAEKRVIAFDSPQSIVAAAAREKRGQIVNDVTQTPHFLAHPLLPETRAEMALPMLVGDTVVGVLDVQASQVGHFTDDDVRVKTTLADQIAIAIQNARAYQEVEQARKETQRIFETSTDMIGSADFNGHFLTLNPAWERILGYTHDELLAKPFIDFVHPDDVQMTIAEAGKIYQGSDTATFTNRYLAKDGQYRWIEWSTASDVAAQMVYFVARDVTDEKAAAEALEQARRETQRIFDTSTDMIGSSNFEGFFLALNPAWERILGYARDELMAKPFIDFVHPDDVQMTIAEAGKIYQGNDTATFTNRYLAKDGQYRWIEWSTASDVAAQRVYFVARDVTEQKRIADEVARNNALLNAIINATPDWIFTKDRDFRYTMVNEGFAKSMQLTPSDVVGKTDIELGFPEEIVFGNFDKGIIGFRNDDMFVIESGQEIHNPYDPAKTADGATVVFDTRKLPLRDANGQVYGVLGFAHDITEVTRRANEMQTVSEVSTQAARSLNLDELLPNVASLVKERFNLYHAHIYLIDEAEGLLKLTAGAGDVGRQMVSEGRVIPLKAEKSLVATAARRKHGIIANDVTLDENFLAHPLLPDTRAEMAVPLMVGDEVLGVLDVQSDRASRFTDNDVQIQTILAEQIAVAVQNARLFAETNKRAAELQTVSELATETASALNTDAVLQEIVDLVKERFDLYHAHIYLIDSETESLKLAAGAGEIGRTMMGRGHSIPTSAKNSIVARAAREQEGVIVKDVQSFDYFLPNPMLPETRAEMAVPLIASNKVIGVLDVQARQKGRFTAEDLNVYTILAGQVAVTIEKARAYAEIEKQAEREREAAERLREVDRLKSQFLANMSHELRTPLNSIIGYSEVLLDGVDGDLPEDAMEDVQAIHDSGKHLLTLINEILDLAKIEARQMKLDLVPIHTDEFLGEIHKSAYILTKNKSVELLVEKETDTDFIRADKVRLRQIMWNLVSNAVKFTEKGSVTIKYGQQGEMIYIKVIDTGIGIPQDKIGLIFERFSQVDGSSTRRAGGTGLGLTITQQLVHMHGGEIQVESEFGVGSIFTFTVPACPPESKVS